MYKQGITILIILILSLSIRLILIDAHFSNPNFSIQQDNYANYAIALKDGTINASRFWQDTRLFPGYPILIYLLTPIFKSEITTGLIISMVSALLAIYIYWLLTKNIVATVIFSFFPPIWLIQSTKISTEPSTVLLVLLSIFSYKNKNFLLTGLILGIAFNVRLISICLLAALMTHSYFKNNLKVIKMMFYGFVLISSFLFLYNYFIFGSSGIFRQFIEQQSFAKATFGLSQIIKDIFRVVDNHQYRILISGTFYLTLNFLALVQLYKLRKLSPLLNICFYWMTFSLIFIFSISPTPLLEEFGRFSVPFTPALVLGISTLIISKNKLNKYIKQQLT